MYYPDSFLRRQSHHHCESLWRMCVKQAVPAKAPKHEIDSKALKVEIVLPSTS
jgi:hypothetical protein